MIAAGTFVTFLALVLLYVGISEKDMGESETGHGLRAVFCYVGGILFAFGVMLILPPLKERRNANFTVVTDRPCKIEKEIFINKDNTSDTTFYYNFINGTVKDTE